MKSDVEVAVAVTSPDTNENVSTNKPSKAEEDVPMATTKQEGSGKKAGKKRLTRGATSDHDEPMKQSSGDEDQGVKRTTGKKKRQMIDESDDDGQPDIENRNVPNAQPTPAAST